MWISKIRKEKILAHLFQNEPLIFLGSYVLPALSEIKLAAALKWQDDIRTTAGFSSQNSYTVLDLAAFYEIYRDVTLSVFVDNVTDEKYLNSLYWDQAFVRGPEKYWRVCSLEFLTKKAGLKS